MGALATLPRHGWLLDEPPATLLCPSLYDWKELAAMNASPVSRPRPQASVAVGAHVLVPACIPEQFSQRKKDAEMRDGRHPYLGTEIDQVVVFLSTESETADRPSR
jgi:hypothetical protein